MASDWTDAQVSWLWTINFFVTLVMNILYGYALSRVRLTVVVPSLYGFFALSFVGFALGSSQFADTEQLHQAFYVWVSVFSLFHVSVFWSFMADLYNKEQARRLFGFIATGASVGGLVGPLLPVLFANQLNNNGLMVIAALLLVCVAPIIAWLERLKGTELHNTSEASPQARADLGRNPLAGFFFYTSMNSIMYFELKNLLAPFDMAARTQIQSGINLAINFFTIITAVFATGRLASRFGLSAALAITPVMMIGGLVAVSIIAIVWIVAVVQVVLKAGNYAITRPAREMLFTLVDRETRYKTKPVIDTLVYRAGDTINAWFITLLTKVLNLGMGPLALVGAFVAAAWAVTGVILGRAYKKESLQPATHER
jgi:AAA family ATP:ADP antiporter